MGFKIIAVRELTDQERHLIEVAHYSSELPPKYSRRDTIRQIGGGVLAVTVPNLLISGQTSQAGQLQRLANALITGGIRLASTLLQQGDTIRAKFDLVNQQSVQERRPVYNAIETQGLGTTAQDFTYVKLEPGTMTTVQHDGFDAQEQGRNDYLARTARSNKSVDFRVS